MVRFSKRGMNEEQGAYFRWESVCRSLSLQIFGEIRMGIRVKREERPLPKNVDHTPHTVLSISVTRLDIVFA